MQIHLENIGKKFGREWVFKNVNQNFNTSNPTAILGPNGSGKSTFLQIIAGNLIPNEGLINYKKNNLSIEIENIYKYLSFTATYIDLISELTLKELLEFHFCFKDYYENLNYAELISILGFEKQQHKFIRNFSSGMKQRVKLVCAICSNSDLLILDEPCSNLDHSGIEWYHDLIKKFGRNKLIFVGSNREHEYDFCTNKLAIEDFK